MKFSEMVTLIENKKSKALQGRKLSKAQANEVARRLLDVWVSESMGQKLIDSVISSVKNKE